MPYDFKQIRTPQERAAYYWLAEELLSIPVRNTPFVKLKMINFLKKKGQDVSIDSPDDTVTNMAAQTVKPAPSQSDSLMRFCMGFIDFLKKNIEDKDALKRLEVQVRVRFLQNAPKFLPQEYQELMHGSDIKEITRQKGRDQEKLKYQMENYISGSETWQSAFELLGKTPRDVATMILKKSDNLQPCEKALVIAMGAGYSPEMLLNECQGTILSSQGQKDDTYLFQIKKCWEALILQNTDLSSFFVKNPKKIAKVPLKRISITSTRMKFRTNFSQLTPELVVKMLRTRKLHPNDSPVTSC